MQIYLLVANSAPWSSASPPCSPSFQQPKEGGCLRLPLRKAAWEGSTLGSLHGPTLSVNRGGCVTRSPCDQADGGMQGEFRGEAIDFKLVLAPGQPLPPSVFIRTLLSFQFPEAPRLQLIPPSLMWICRLPQMENTPRL